MPRGITQQNVFAAADTLLQRGERPTIERVRRELGRGSPNTVNPLLDAWWRSLRGRLRGDGDEAQDVLPAALLEAVQGLYERIHNTAIEESHAQLVEERQKLEARELALNERGARIEAEREALSAPLEVLKQELEAQHGVNQALSASERDLQQALAEAQAEATRLSELLAKAETDHKRLTEAHTDEMARLREQQDAQEKHWLVEIDRLRQELKQSRAETTKSRSHVAQLEKRLTRAQDAETAQRRELQSLQKTLSREREARIRAEAKTVATEDLAEMLRRASRGGGSRKSLSSSKGTQSAAKKGSRKKVSRTRKNSKSPITKAPDKEDEMK